MKDACQTVPRDANLIRAVKRQLPRQFQRTRFMGAVIGDESVTLIGPNAEIDLLRDEAIDRAVIAYLSKAA